MAGSGPDDFHALALDLLDVAADALDSTPTFAGLGGLKAAPERQFVHPGVPVWDECEQLVVHAGGLADRFALPKAVFDKVNVPALTVTILRCLPQATVNGKTIVAPSSDDLTAAARQHHADAWALWNHIFNAIRAGSFLTRCTEVSFVSMIPFAPAGGYGGWQMNFSAVLDGYEEP